MYVRSYCQKYMELSRKVLFLCGQQPSVRPIGAACLKGIYRIQQEQTSYTHAHPFADYC